ncbi:MAG: DUF2802 domain-containing protein, partial [Gammaproteobacteria bacterium]|nr:DUF2802 domain-containing protein [Gammaproteobacteria bacterium]
MIPLVIALVALGLICMGLAMACVWLLQQQRLAARLQAERDAQRDLRIKDLAKRLDTYLTGSVRMGEELHELRRTVA